VGEHGGLRFGGVEVDPVLLAEGHDVLVSDLHFLPGTPEERNANQCDGTEDSSKVDHHELIRDVADGPVLEQDVVHQVGDESEAEACAEPDHDQGDSPEPPVPEGIQEVEKLWPDGGHDEQKRREAHGVTPFLVLLFSRRGLFP